MLALLCLLSVVLSTFAFVPVASAQPVIDVQVGFEGRHRPGTDLLVQIDIRADQLVDGELRITTGGGGPDGVVVVLPVEIAGGVQKRYTTVVPDVLQWQGDTTISLVDGATVLVQQRVQFQPEFEDELVGVLPALAENAPGIAALTVALGDARIFPIDDALLRIGPGTVDALGTIVVTSGDLDALSQEGRASLRSWVGAGGTLVVDDASGPIAGFDVTPSASGDRLGLGRIVSSGGSLAAGRWDGVLDPTPFAHDPSGNGGLTGEITGEVAWFGGLLANSLASDAGFGLPPMGLVLPLMAGYVLLVGPIAWLVLRRMGRSGLLWVALPAIALLFTGFVWAGGGAVRSGTSDSHGTVIRIENGYASADSTVLVSSANGSTAAIELPAGWQAKRTADTQFGFDFQMMGDSSTSVRPGPDATRIEATLDAGAFALLGANGPAPRYVDALVVQAESSTDGVTTGRVTNGLDVPLADVAVFVGTQAFLVGTLDAGATKAFEVSDVGPPFRGGMAAELRVWGDNTRGFASGDVDETGAINLSLWANFLSTNMGRVRQPGTVSVVGWSDELASPLDPSVDQGRTAILARADVRAAGGVVSDVAGPRVLLRGAEEGGFGDNDFRFIVSTVWRFGVPDGFVSSELALQLPNNVAAIDVWDGTDWITLDAPVPGRYALPADALVAGELYLRPRVDFDRQGLLGREFALVSVEPGADLRRDLVEGASS